MPGAEQLAPFYRYENYAEPLYGNSRRSQRSRRHLANELLEDVEKERGGPGSLLDVGSSTGLLLEVGRDRGWQVRGIELDPTTARRARERLGVEVTEAAGLEGLGEDAVFDLVVMSHWVEHTPTPREAVQRAWARLRPRGFLLIRVPNRDSLVARFSGANWSWFVPPIHLTYFSGKGLDRLVTESGFSVVWSRRQRGDALLYPFELLLAFMRGLFGAGIAPGETPPPKDPARNVMRKLLTYASRTVEGGSAGQWLSRHDDAELVMLACRTERRPSG